MLALFIGRIKSPLCEKGIRSSGAELGGAQKILWCKHCMFLSTAQSSLRFESALNAGELIVFK